MNLSLKNVKIHPDMSRETNCFSATIYLDGKRVGRVENNGNGGPHRFDWHYNHEAGKEIVAWSLTQETEFDFEKLDQIVDELLVKHEENRQLKRWCKKETVFRLKGDGKEWRIISRPFDAAIKQHLVEKHGDQLDCIANELN